MTEFIDIGGVWVNPALVFSIEPHPNNSTMCFVVEHGPKGRIVTCTKSAAKVAQLLNGE